MTRSPALLVIGVSLALAACGGSSSSSPSTSSSTPATSSSTAATSTPSAAPTTGGPKISSATVAGLGAILVNAQGKTLYIFIPDKHQKVTCVSACAAIWPPAFAPSGQKPVAAGQVKQSLLASDPDPSGGQVITYAGWPLYTYVPDTSPGQHAGQAVNLNGGLWYVISPAGKVITTKP